MKRTPLYYAIAGGCMGLVLMGFGWGLSNYYLLTAGAVVLAASIAWLSIPMPAIF